MNATLILSSLGGIVAFIAVVATAIKAIFRLVNSINANTDSNHELKKSLDEVIARVNSHDTDIQVLKDRFRRR